MNMFFLLAALAMTAAARTPAGLSGANLTELASGFVWAENMVFDTSDNLLVTDDLAG